MSAIKKFNLLIVGILLAFAGCFLYACGGPNYSKVTITASEQALLIDEGDEREITFTINNFSKGMDNSLDIYNDNSAKVSVDLVSETGAQTTIRVKGLSHGTAHITATLKDGGKSADVTVIVSKYADFESGDNELYVSESDEFTPKASDFKFVDGDKRDLDFYFYGIAENLDSLYPNDIMVDGVYGQHFESISLIHQDGKNLLIFRDGEQLYSIASPRAEGLDNVKLVFIEAHLQSSGSGETRYTFSGPTDPYNVPLGQKLAFMAIYRGAQEHGIQNYYVAREFTVIGDLPTQIEYSYYYKDKPETVYRNQPILFMPNGETDEDSIYKQIVLQVEIAGSAALSDMPYYDESVCNVERSDMRGDEGIFSYEVNSRSMGTIDGRIRLSYFYSQLGYIENSSVSRDLFIDVQVKYQPSPMTINGRPSGASTYTLYNKYFGSSSAGFQNLKVDFAQSDAVFDTLEIRFDDSVIFQYENEIIESGYVINYEPNISINLQMRGAKVVDSGHVTFILNYNIVKPQVIEYILNYEVKQGADDIVMQNENYQNGIYLSMHNDDSAIEFAGLYATAEFEYATMSFVSGENVVGLKESIKCDANSKNELLMKLQTNQTGDGRYLITLDNGFAKEFVFKVRDKFSGANLFTSNKGVTIDNVQSQSDGYSADVYILNNLTPQTNTSVYPSPFGRIIDLQFKTLNGEKAISNVQYGEGETAFLQQSRIRFDQTSIEFALQTMANGNGQIKLEIWLEEVDENNFVLKKQEQPSLIYTLNITSFTLIDRMEVTKVSDGLSSDYNGEQANYAYVYNNTQNVASRSAVFDVKSASRGYMFQNPAWTYGSGLPKYLFDVELKNAIRWTSDKTSEIMYYATEHENNYVIGDYGTFNTDTMTFTAYSNSAGKLKLSAQITQVNATYSFVIQIEIREYVNVSDLSFSEPLEMENGQYQIAFSPNGDDDHAELIIITESEEGKAPTNPSIAYRYTPSGNDDEKSFFDRSIDWLTPLENGTYLLSLNCTDEFKNSAMAQSGESLTGRLEIYAKDWLTPAGEISSQYLSSVKTIYLKYQNGTKENPFYLADSEDVQEIKDAPSAYYIIARTIDISQLSLPICADFSGTITGTKDYAELLGITITNESEIDNNYGLFGLVSGTINNVKFSGHIQVSGVDKANVGIIAGQNTGNIINVGVTTNDNSQISGNGNFGLVAGKNSGLIAQDYIIYSDSSSDNIFAGLSTRILLYSNHTLTVNENGQSNIGGVVGLNEGKIFKFDNDKLRLLNYGNYLAYTQINVNNSSPETKVGVVAGYSTQESMIAGGNVKDGLITDEILIPNAPKIAGKATLEGGTLSAIEGGYNIGTGILVGGSVTLDDDGAGEGYAGGVVGVFGTVGGQIGSSETNFYGVTSRVFVRGGSVTSDSAHIGAIAGYALAGIQFVDILTGEATEGAEQGLYSPFAVQAVDDGRDGTQASMVVVTLKNSAQGTGTIADAQKIGFGAGSNLEVLYKEDNGGYKQNIFTYVKREQRLISGEKLKCENENSTSYYGDYIIIENMTDSGKFIYAQDFFGEGDENVSITSNEGFAQFEKTTDVFYAFYFAIGTTLGNDPSALKTLLDRQYNLLSPSSPLYPFMASRELSLTSLSTNLVSIDESGIISINGTGVATLRVTSLLNRNVERNIYLKCTNYFNDDQDLSIIYQADNLTIPVGKTEIDLQGNKVIDLVVRPDYSLIESGRKVFGSNGRGEVGGVTVTLAANSDVEICAEITSFASKDGIVYRRTGDMLEATDERGETQQLGSYAGLIPLDGNNFAYYGGQSLSIMRDQKTEQGIFNIHLYTRLGATVDGQSYFAKVNLETYEGKGDDTYTSITYTPGVEKMSVSFDILHVTTSGDYSTTLFVLSQSDETSPVRFDIWSWDNPGINYKDLFNIQFIKKDASITSGEQTFTTIISVNKESDFYKDRLLSNIYIAYKLRIYANTSDAFVDIKLNLKRSEVTNVIVDNYKRSQDTSSPSSVALAGQQGLLMINLSPYDAEFDYIDILNDEQNYLDGNGNANFNLLAKLLNANGNPYQTSNVGQLITNNENRVIGLRLTQKDIVDLYATKSGDADLYENYHGMLYIAYYIGTQGVVDGGKARFNIVAYKSDGQTVENTPPLVLDIELSYRVGLTLEAEQDSDHVYHVARGQDYVLSLDYYGFALNEVDVQIPTQFASYITKRIVDDKYIIHVDENFVYNINDEIIVKISAEANQKEGDLLRHAESEITLELHEYVVRSNPLSDDIVEGMDGGIIHVQIGNSVTFELDASQFIDYNPNLPDVARAVRTFVSGMTSGGTWTAYTNLRRDNGYPDMTRVDISRFDSNVYYKATLSPTERVANYYFTAQGLEVMPKITHDYFSQYYAFEYQGYYNEEFKGIYQQTAESVGARSLRTTFVLDVYQSSSLESPIPIENLEQLFAMKPNSHYRLVADITLPADFEQITTTIASFDGNGYTIFYGSEEASQTMRYNFSTSNIGLFANLERGTLIKNVIIGLKSDVEFHTTEQNFNAGLLAGVNNGNISGCQVYSNGNYLITLCDNLISDSFTGGLVGRNGGNITNSRSEVNIKSTFNIGGLVGQNAGVIASSFVRSVVLDGEGGMQNHHVGGLVVINETDGRISTSYVSGENSDDRPYSDDENHYIKSPQEKGGFAHTNLGAINDCYSNIRIVSSHMAGFVYANSGSIRNAFSLSVLENNRNTSAGFVMTSDGTYSYENCYYFYNNGSEEGCNEAFGNINTTLNDRELEGIKALNIKGFENLSEYFDEFAYEEEPTTNAVWCYSTNANLMSTLFAEQRLEPNPLDPENPDESTLTRTFSVGRLELVAPNVIAFSSQIVSETIEDEETGDVTYRYRRVAGGNEGSATNPRLVGDAQTLENYFMSASSLSSNYNNEHYRLIADIDYNSLNINSQLYKVTYFGTLEGNGMRLTNIRLVSNENIKNAGLFAQLGRDATHRGVVMNLTYAPREVTFVNANCVGGIAGTMTYGALYNVEVTRYVDDEQTEDNELVIQGKNFVGGLIGRAIDGFTIKNAISNVAVISNYAPSTDDFSYSTLTTRLSDYSYAGGIVGYAGGAGNMHRLYVNEISDIMGDRVGVIAGGIDSGTHADHLYVNLSTNLKIKSFAYAGLAVGELKGTISQVQVGGAEGEYNNFFALIPEIPSAIGGVVGVLSGGTIDSAYMGQNFTVNNIIDDTTKETTKQITSMGGIVGMVANGSDSTIKNSIVDVPIVAIATNLGGVAGLVSSGLTISNVVVRQDVSLALKQQISNDTSARIRESVVGGFVGTIASGITVNINNSYTMGSVNVETHHYNTTLTANVGHFVGAGTPATMQNVYALGVLNVTIADRRDAEAEIGKVTRPDQDKIRYNNTIKNRFDGSKVLFYGVSSGGYSNGSYAELNEMTNFQQKSKHYQIIFNADYLGSPTQNVLTEFNKTLNKEVWNSDAASETYVPLVMESSFNWLIQMNNLPTE